MLEVLQTVESIMLVVFLCCFYLYVGSSKRDTSKLITLAFVCIVELIMLGMNSILLSVDDLHWQNFLWYNSYALLDILVAVGILRLHNLYNIQLHFVAKHTVVTYLTFSFFQLYTYLDALFIRSELIEIVYPVFVVSLSISIFVVVTGAAMTDVISAEKLKLRFLNWGKNGH